MLTILDSDEEEEEEEEKKPTSNSTNGKGKGKAKVQEITLSDSEDEDNDDNSDASDEFMPSPEKRKKGDDSEGELGDSGDEDVKPSKTRSALSAKGDFRSSTKLEALVKSLQAAKAKDPNLKAVVFSQVSLSLFPFVSRVADILIRSHSSLASSI